VAQPHFSNFDLICSWRYG